MLTQSQRNDRSEILAALAGGEIGDPFVRAVVAEVHQIDRRACEQIAFLGDVPDVINMPPITDEVADIALAIWAGDSNYVVSPEVQLEIEASCCGRLMMAAASGAAAWLLRPDPAPFV